jgi:tetratricopeptide (TPR) repeat protein
VSICPFEREARDQWEEGQAAMQYGKLDKAVECYQRSLAADPKDARIHLSLAAAFLVKGEDESAQRHLAKYVRAHPENWEMRLRYAELLTRMRRLPEARAEFERVVADAQLASEPDSHQLVHCQTRLMEIAEAEGDEYALHLHRGIGVYFIACQYSLLGKSESANTTEALLCQAAGELALARLECPQEARPCWYLYQVWNRLDLRKPALHHLREADAAATFSYLTPAEQSGLNLACRELLHENPFRR